MRRPEPSEYDAFYRTYVDKVPAGDVLEILDREGACTVALLSGVPRERETYRYAPDKWTIRELVGHLIDTERLFAYRALAFARADPAPLPGMDQDVWAEASNAARRPLAELRDELALVRRSSVALFAGFDDAAWDRRGVASGCEFTVRAFPFIIAGHEIHHRGVLEARYLR